MRRVKELLPEFMVEVTSSLGSMGRKDLADQICDVELEKWTHDYDSDALYLYLSGQRPLNVVEQNVIGVRHGRSIELTDVTGTVVIDLDNFNRLKGIEVLWRKDLAKKLELLYASNRAI